MLVLRWCYQCRVWQRGQHTAVQGSVAAHLGSLLEAMTRSQSRTRCFFRNFFVRYLRYLQQGGRARACAYQLLAKRAGAGRRGTAPAAPTRLWKSGSEQHVTSDAVGVDACIHVLASRGSKHQPVSLRQARFQGKGAILQCI